MTTSENSGSMRSRHILLKFLLRKSWILTWDHIGTVLLVNLAFSLLCALLFIAARSLASSQAGLAVMLCAGAWLLTWYLRGVHLFLQRIVLFETAGFRLFLRCLKGALRNIAGLGAFFFLYALIPLLGIPFYLSTRSFGGYMAAAIIFWVYVAAFPAVIMLLPLLAGEKGEYTGLLAAFKKAFHLLFIEPKTMIILSCNAAAFFVLSVLTGFLLPGMASVVILTESAGVLLSEEADARFDRIAGEEELMGKRTLKSFLLPWKN